MNRKVTTPITSLLLSLIVLNSCIRDFIPPCPPLSVQIAVKDKNYSNVHKVELEEALNEDLAFREYIPTLYYRLCPLGSDKPVYEQEIFEVQGDEKTYPVVFSDDLPHGTYVLTVWGGLHDHAPLDADGDRTSIEFHPGGTEGDDVYMTNDTLVYDAWHYDYNVEMQRTKGKLVVLFTGLSEGMTGSENSVSGLYQRMDRKFGYSGSTEVSTKYVLDSPEVVTRTVLAPSTEHDGSTLQITFDESPGKAVPHAEPESVDITIGRNELTALKYVFNATGYTIYILVDDDWEKVHGMEID